MTISGLTIEHKSVGLDGKRQIDKIRSNESKELLGMFIEFCKL